jgi:hypothetical protein
LFPLFRLLALIVVTDDEDMVEILDMLLLKGLLALATRLRLGLFPTTDRPVTPQPGSSPPPLSKDSFDVLSPKDDDRRLEKLEFREERCFRDERGIAALSPSFASQAENASMLLKLLFGWLSRCRGCWPLRIAGFRLRMIEDLESHGPAVCSLSTHTFSEGF